MYLQEHASQLGYQVGLVPGPPLRLGVAGTPRLSVCAASQDALSPSESACEKRWRGGSACKFCSRTEQPAACKGGDRSSSGSAAGG